MRPNHWFADYNLKGEKCALVTKSRADGLRIASLSPDCPPVRNSYCDTRFHRIVVIHECWFCKKDVVMSVRTVAGKFMELCRQGKHFEFMRTTYAPDMVSIEGDGKETVGKQPVISKSEIFQGDNAIHSQDLRGPFFCGDANASSGRFGVYMSIDFSLKTGGKRVTHEEVGLYTVKNDTVTREEFFYEGPFI